jgi:hypothetical protein
VWRAIRRQAPLTRARLSVFAELLAILTETLLSENIYESLGTHPDRNANSRASNQRAVVPEYAGLLKSARRCGNTGSNPVGAT